MGSRYVVECAMVASLVESMADILDIATIGKVELKQCFDHKLDG